MLICLFVAIIATLIWINVTVADIVDNRFNANGKENGKLKTYLAFIIAIFWAIVIRYGG